MRKSYRERNGSERNRTFKKNQGPQVQLRLKSALQRMEAQYIVKTKPEKKTNNLIPMTEKDLKRLGKEITSVKKRIV